MQEAFLKLNRKPRKVSQLKVVLEKIKDNFLLVQLTKLSWFLGSTL